MKKENIFKIINIIIVSLLIFSFISFILSIHRLNITPFKYNIIIYIILTIIAFFILLEVLFVHNKTINVITIIIEVFIICITFIGIKKLNNIDSFFNRIKYIEETSVYYVVTLNDNKYNNINNLKNKKIGILNNIYNLKASEELNKVINYNMHKYDSLTLMLNDLKDQNIDAILLNSTTLDIMLEQDNNLNIKKIYEVTIKNTYNPVNEVENEIINILISGVDVAGDISIPALSDVNIIMTVNPNSHEILLTSIPRDTYVHLHGIDGINDKLTHSAIYGIDMTKATIEDFLNIKIDYYIRLNFTSLVNVVDAIGGVDVYSDQAFSEYGYYYKEGYNHLDGQNALYYSRIRHVFASGDRKRGEHQKQVIEAIIHKVTSSKSLLLNYERFLDSLSTFFQTTIPTNIIKKYVRNQIDTMAEWQVKSIAVTGIDYEAETYSIPGYRLYVLIPDNESISYCSNMINDMKKGKSIFVK